MADAAPTACTGTVAFEITSRTDGEVESDGTTFYACLGHAAVALRAALDHSEECGREGCGVYWSDHPQRHRCIANASLPRPAHKGGEAGR